MDTLGPEPTPKQLENAVTMMYRTEVHIIQKTKFATEAGKVRVLLDAKDAYAAAIEILHVLNPDPDDQHKNELYKAVQAFGRTNIRSSIVNIQNMKLRAEYNKNIVSKSEKYMEDSKAILPEADGSYTEANLRAIEAIKNEASSARNAILDMMRSQQTEPSLAFSKWLKEEGVTPTDLLRRYQSKYMKEHPGLSEDFKHWESADQAGVYEMIIEAAGRSRIWVTSLSKALGNAGKGIVIFNVGMFILDIINNANEHVYETILKDSLEFGVGYAGAVATEAMVTAAMEALGASAGSIFAFAIVAGLVAEFGIGLAIESLFDTCVVYFTTFPKTVDQRLWGQPMLYNFPLPDGAAIINQAMHT